MRWPGVVLFCMLAASGVQLFRKTGLGGGRQFTGGHVTKIALSLGPGDKRGLTAPDARCDRLRPFRESRWHSRSTFDTYWNNPDNPIFP